MKFASLLTVLSALLLGCVSNNSPHSEFVKTITFSSLNTFSYKHTLTAGMDFKKSEELFLEEHSEEILTAEFTARGFEQVDEGSDFFVVTKWRKAVSSYPDAFDHIDGPMDSMARRDNPSYRFASRIHLFVEVYETSSGDLFWRKELPNVFDAVQLTEERVVESLKRAVKNFPERVAKDPNLPDIE